MENKRENEFISIVKGIVKVRFFIFLFLSIFMSFMFFNLIFLSYPQIIKMSSGTLFIIILTVFLPLTLLTIWPISISIISLLPLLNPNKYIKIMTENGYLWPFFYYYRANKFISTIQGKAAVHPKLRGIVLNLYKLYTYTIGKIPSLLGLADKILVDVKEIPNTKEEIIRFETEYIKNTYKIREEELKLNRINELSEAQKKRLRAKDEYSIITRYGRVKKTLNKWSEPLVEIENEKYEVISEKLFLMIPQYIPIKIYIYVDKKKKVVINFE